MPRYRSIPWVVNAVQFDPDGIHRELQPEGVFRLKDRVDAKHRSRPGNLFCVETIQGEIVAVGPGEYVVTEPDGLHHYPCKAEVFEAKYKPIPEGEQ